MPSTLDTIYGVYISPRDNLSVKDVGGHREGQRRTLIIFDRTNDQIVNSLDIQSDSSKERFLDFLEKSGFEQAPCASIGGKLFAPPDLKTHFRTADIHHHIQAQIFKEVDGEEKLVGSFQVVSSRPREEQISGLETLVTKHGYKPVKLAERRLEAA